MWSRWLEEDRIAGYFAGGALYADAVRATEPLLYERDFDGEPVRGLAGSPLPAGETLLWQGLA
jgi:hypothetical protein